MIKSITIINDFGEKKVIELGAPETSGLWVKAMKGIGPGKANINVTDMASSDGGIYNSARSEVRNITLTLGFIPYTIRDGNKDITYSVEDVRRDLYKWFAKKRWIEFIVNMEQSMGLDDNRQEIIRKFSLGTDGYVESNEPDIFNKEETTSISIICPDPNMYIYDENGNITSEALSFSATDDTFTWCTEFYYDREPEELDNYCNEVSPTDEYFLTTDTVMQPGKEYFELVNGEYVSTEDINSFADGKTYYEYQSVTELAKLTTIATKETDYDGEIEIGLHITINILGEVSGLALYKIYDAYHYDTIALDDASMSLIIGGGLTAGDEIHISTINGKKNAILIREAVEYNIMNALGKNPSWFKLDQGINTFSYGAASGAESVFITISYEKAYEGV